MSMVDLFSNETFDQRNKNRDNLFNLYGHNTAHKLKKVTKNVKFINIIKLANLL